MRVNRNRQCRRIHTRTLCTHGTHLGPNVAIRKPGFRLRYSISNSGAYARLFRGIDRLRCISAAQCYFSKHGFHAPQSGM